MFTGGSEEHFTGWLILTVTVGLAFTISVAEPLAVQPVALFVIITLYEPATDAEKLATLPGLVALAGTVHV
jgi:hypothetical protein